MSFYKVTPFEIYKSYIGIKNHFTRDSYDYHQYCGKTKTSIESFYKRRDRFFFEKISRQKNDSEVIDFFVANFISCTDPQKLWIGEMIKTGEKNYSDWKRRIQSLSYFFKEEMQSITLNRDFNSLFLKSYGHPIILKKYLSGEISLETLVICDKILGYRKDFDKKMNDPVWESISHRIKKYSSFLNIDVFHYKKILKEVVINGN
jgi:hypothetical protein